ncbi:MAG: hypothetical protein LUH07_04885 [Lachnospiraceae bacterium]|nr:hypothetical protein [Lachnospiraceae bacterium]
MVKFMRDEAESSEQNRIRQVKTSLSPDGKKAKISCDTRNQKEYSWYFVFDVTEDEYNSGMRLDALVHSDKIPDIVDCSMPHDHTVTLSRTGVRCLHYLARYDALQHSYYLLDQSQDNASDLLKIQPTIRCQVNYEPIRTGLFGLGTSAQQKAIMKIGGDKPMQGTSLVYCLTGGGRDRTRFGIDLAAFWNKELQITIKKTEKLKILPPEDGTYRLQA